MNHSITRHARTEVANIGFRIFQTFHSVRAIEGEGLLINLDMHGIAVSTGSACSSGSLEPSPVIRALGRNDELARGAIRFSFGKFNTEEDVENVLDVLPQSVENMRKLSPNWNR